MLEGSLRRIIRLTDCINIVVIPRYKCTLVISKMTGPSTNRWINVRINAKHENMWDVIGKDLRHVINE